CTSWVFGETLSCEQCGKECAEKCGTRQFRACCFNNMKKRQLFTRELVLIPPISLLEVTVAISFGIEIFLFPNQETGFSDL
ncbi:unnamed protein product, partial [Heterotrigona itama]